MIGKTPLVISVHGIGVIYYGKALSDYIKIEYQSFNPHNEDVPGKEAKRGCNIRISKHIYDSMKKYQLDYSELDIMERDNICQRVYRKNIDFNKNFILAKIWSSCYPKHGDLNFM